MYHIELRQFPHNSNRFNLTERELHAAILDAWARGDWIEFGERKWSPHQAKLTVLEGPELELAELAMGRGWRNAKRQSKDVTEDLLAAARRAPSDGSPHAQGSAIASRDAVEATIPPIRSTHDPNHLVGELLSLLGDDPLPLLRAWQLALERHPDRTPSECLALAEDLLRG